MHRYQQDGAAAPGLAAPELAHQECVDLAPPGTTKALPDVGASNDEALAGGAAQGSRGQKKADASIVPDTDAADKARHPLSAAFGDMPTDEFAELVRDIKRNGQISDIVKSEDGRILDGWHRYRACIEAGVKPRIEPFSDIVEAASEVAGRKMTEAEFACSQNAHRRHLSAEQRRSIVAELLKADPSKSNRTVASVAKVDDKTVGVVRAKLEATAAIPQLTKTTGKDGKARAKPAKPKTKTPTKAPTPPGPRGPGARNVVVVDGVEVLDPGHARPAAHKPFFDLCGIPADDFKEAATVQGVMRGFAEFCGEHDPVHVAHALQQHEVQAMREWVSTVRAWLDAFESDLGAEVSE